MLELIVPASSAVVEAYGDLPDAFLLPAESAALGAVVERRRREFTMARTCARRALGRLGLSPAAIPIGPNREPVWPEGVVGSITHCTAPSSHNAIPTTSYCAAVVARQMDLATIGIDAEIHAPLPHGVLDLVAHGQERAWLGALPAIGICWDRVLFSAKESVYKAWFQLAGRWLGFEDVSLLLEPTAGTFFARLHVPGLAVEGCPLTEFHGKYLIAGDLVLTAAVIAACASGD